MIEETPLGPGELRIRANRGPEGSEGKLHYEGFVDLRFGQSRIQADALDLIDDPRPGGGSSQRLEATGNVVFMSGEERISARPPERRSTVENSWKTRTGSSELSTVTDDARRIRRVRPAIAPSRTSGAEMTKSGR